MSNKMKQEVGLEITKDNISEYANKRILALAKEKKPVEQKKGFNINLSFSWNKRINGMSGYSGYSGYYREGDLEHPALLKIEEVSPSGECLKYSTWDTHHIWDEGRVVEYWNSRWTTVDSFLDYYFFIELLD